MDLAEFTSERSTDVVVCCDGVHLLNVLQECCSPCTSRTFVGCAIFRIFYLNGSEKSDKECGNTFVVDIASFPCLPHFLYHITWMQG